MPQSKDIHFWALACQSVNEMVSFLRAVFIIKPNDRKKKQKQKQHRQKFLSLFEVIKTHLIIFVVHP